MLFSQQQLVVAFVMRPCEGGPGGISLGMPASL